MKKYAVLITITGLATAGLLSLPVLADALVPQVRTVQMQQMPYTETVTVSGTVEEEKKKEISLDLPIVPEQVMVQVGEEVEAGDVLATIDINATKNAIAKLASQYIDLIPQELQAAIENFDLEKLLSSGAFPTEIVSTASGTVTNLSLTEGNLALPKSTAAVVATTDKLRARFYVSEKDAAKIKEGSEVLFTASAVDNGIFAGSVLSVAPAAYQRFSGLNYETVVDVAVNIDNTYGLLKSGYTIKGNIPVGETREVNLLPYESIQQDENGTEYVYAYEKGRAKRRNIETGEEFSTSTEILSGISPEDAVIFNSADVKDGGLVRLSR